MAGGALSSRSLGAHRTVANIKERVCEFDQLLTGSGRLIDGCYWDITRWIDGTDERASKSPEPVSTTGIGYGGGSTLQDGASIPIARVMFGAARLALPRIPPEKVP